MGLGSFFKRGKKESKKESEDSHITIKTEDCDGCEKCAVACSNSVLMITDGVCTVRDAQVCRSCRVCMAICPNNCITVS